MKEFKIDALCEETGKTFSEVAHGYKNLGGRPRKEIDYVLLEKLCRILCTGEECASIQGMSYETLNNHLTEEGHGGFLEYNKRFAGEGKASLRRMQWKGAEAGNTSMLIWLGKQYLDQTDKQDLNHGGRPLKVDVAVNGRKVVESALTRCLGIKPDNE